MSKGICSVPMGSDARQVRDGGKQFAGVVVFWLVQDLFGVAHFQELPGAHDGDACGHLSDHRQAEFPSDQDAPCRVFATNDSQRRDRGGAFVAAEFAARFERAAG